MNCHLQASQGGYGVEYTQGPQSGYPGNYLNQSAHPGYPHMGATNDIVSQVRSLQFVTIALHLLNFLLMPFPEHVYALCTKHVCMMQDHMAHGTHGIDRKSTRLNSSHPV